MNRRMVVQTTNASGRESSIAFATAEETELYCYNACRSPIDSANQEIPPFSRWCGRKVAQGFLQNTPCSLDIKEEMGRNFSPCPSFTLIGGYGNGTSNPLSIDEELFEDVVDKFMPQNRIRETVCSVHGVFACFMERNENAPTSLFILLATPTDSTRKLFCALRIIAGSSSATCLVFDDKRADLSRTVRLLCSLTSETIRRNPATLIAALIREIGCTCELSRRDLADIIRNAEASTGSTSWQDMRGPLTCWPRGSHGTMNTLHLSQSKLLFVAQTADFEIDAWRRLRAMVENKQSILRPQEPVSQVEQLTLLDTIEYELSHTMNRRAQIGYLRERIGVQINLVNNIIAHQKSSQTGLIAILALTFAPASLLIIAGMFSADIFPSGQGSWVAYTASTVPATLMTLAAGLKLLPQQKLGRAWQMFHSVLRLTNESPWENQYY